MEPVTLTTDRLVLRPVGPGDTDAVYAAAQDPDIQRWTTIPSPYLREHAEGFVERPGTRGLGGRLDVHLRRLPARRRPGRMLSQTMRAPGVAEIGFWAAKEHRGHGYLTEADARRLPLGLHCSWPWTAWNGARRSATRPRSRWRASAGFTLEGTARAGLLNQGVRRDCWTASLLPSDLGLPPKTPYLPAPDRSRAVPEA